MRQLVTLVVVQSHEGGWRHIKGQQPTDTPSLPVHLRLLRLCPHVTIPLKSARCSFSPSLVSSAFITRSPSPSISRRLEVGHRGSTVYSNAAASGERGGDGETGGGEDRVHQAIRSPVLYLRLLCLFTFSGLPLRAESKSAFMTEMSLAAREHALYSVLCPAV